MVENCYNLLDCLRDRNYSISIDSVVDGKLAKLVKRGLRVLALCNDGTGRSKIVSENLSKRGIPAISLSDGLKSADKNHDLFPYLVNEINQVPFVGVILTPEEIKSFFGIIQNLRAHKYSNSTSAIESLSKMAGGV